MMENRRFLLAIAFLASIGGASASGEVKMPRDAEVIAELDTCLGPDFADHVRAKFTERFPHERCDDMADCLPELRKSAEILARRACRVSSFASCLKDDGKSVCLEALDDRWTARYGSLKSTVVAGWQTMDTSKVSPLALRRFEKVGAFEAPDADCPNFREEYGLPTDLDMQQKKACRAHIALANLEHIEGLAGYLATLEAQQ